MFVVYKNGTKFLETESYQKACSAARMDAYRNRLSAYAIWDKATADKPIRGESDKPLYRITGGVTYTIPNPPVKEAA